MRSCRSSCADQRSCRSLARVDFFALRPRAVRAVCLARALAARPELDLRPAGPRRGVDRAFCFARAIESSSKCKLTCNVVLARDVPGYVITREIECLTGVENGCPDRFSGTLSTTSPPRSRSPRLHLEHQADGEPERTIESPSVAKLTRVFISMHSIYIRTFAGEACIQALHACTSVFRPTATA